MSAGYASRLSKYDNKGVCGLPETTDPTRVLKIKLTKLADMVRNANHLVVLTGAGISTSAGIPDFRGPRGIWTIEQQLRKNYNNQNKKKKKKKNHRTTMMMFASGENGGGSMTQSTQPVQASKEHATDDQNNSETHNISIPNSHDAVSPPLTSDKKRKRGVHNLQITTDGPLSSSNNNDINNNNNNPSSSSSASSSFEKAKPTLTHRAITFLAKPEINIIKFCITQNVDGLHRRSGLSRSRQSILHGCVFTEKCEVCGMEYFRDYDVGGVSFQKTGRRCTSVIATPASSCSASLMSSPSLSPLSHSSLSPCNGDLRDTVLDWEDELPEQDYNRAQIECDSSDLVLCLGTSLRIEPAGSLPTRAKKFVIVNLQPTPYDEEAVLVIRARVDDVMKDLIERLGYVDWDEENK